MEINPKKRIKPYDGLNHDWIQMHVKNKTVNPDTLLNPVLDNSESYKDCMEKAWKGCGHNHK